MIHWFFTISRLFTVPFILLTMKQKNFKLTLALILYAITSDFFDGFFARKLSKTSKIGALADAIIDKIFVNATMFAFCLYIKPDDISLKILLGIWLIRDIAMTILSIFATKPFVSLYLGKLYATLQFFLLFVIFVSSMVNLPIFAWFVWVMSFIFIILGAISTKQYYNSML